MNAQLDGHGVRVTEGMNVDASLTKSPRYHHGKPTYEVAEDRKQERSTLENIATSKLRLHYFV